MAEPASVVISGILCPGDASGAVGVPAFSCTSEHPFLFWGCNNVFGCREQRGWDESLASFGGSNERKSKRTPLSLPRKDSTREMNAMTVQRTSLNLVHPFLTEWPLVLVVSSAVLLAACGEREPGSRPESSPVSTSPSGQPVLVQAELVEVQVTQAQDKMEVTGKVASRIDATLASKVQGLIQDVRGREGTPVKAGDTLVVLDNRDLKANVSRAEAEVDHARGNLARMKSLFS